ncbi:hypothetical protein PsorP6_008222 [Peronosclerospora sorghi]|uniref:Uncharacterized protein n=1 Tax=Peronosclerospora sorghi TaxID=230839 RepID=A0ACC0WAQ0_9STRA|nr:hypothetical protein PsorP6_008222 [Peronosclerospora sorghi]
MAKCSRCLALENQLAELQAQNAELRAQLDMLQHKVAEKNPEDETKETAVKTSIYSPFSRVELQRYGRQMLVKEFGVQAQLKLRAARVLLVGLGGLGSPAAMYLAAMGVGTLALVDSDSVERSNLHRQILHDEQGVKKREKKVNSAKRRLQALNPLVHCVVYPTRLTETNAFTLVGEYDVVVDASDNVSTRYLVNDACSRLRTPLVSGSALGLEGQVTVFTYRDDEHATGCYRCLYPTPPRVAMSCAENGVLGVVPGIIGCLQAVETVKLITGVGEPLVGVQCFYDAYDSQFRRLKIAMTRKLDCPSCGRYTGIKSKDLLQLVRGRCSDEVEHLDSLGPEFRISVADFAKVRKAAAQAKKEGQRIVPGTYLLLDTRVRIQFEMVHFPEAVNIPTLELMKQDPAEIISTLNCLITSVAAEQHQVIKRIFVICRRGVDSVKVTRWLLDRGIQNVCNIDGGYSEYAKTNGVDPTFPMY